MASAPRLALQHVSEGTPGGRGPQRLWILSRDGVTAGSVPAPARGHPRTDRLPGQHPATRCPARLPVIVPTDPSELKPRTAASYGTHSPVRELKIGHGGSHPRPTPRRRTQRAHPRGVAQGRIYVGHGLSGTNRARPVLREALAACRSGGTLVVPKFARLARSLPDARDGRKPKLTPKQEQQVVAGRPRRRGEPGGARSVSRSTGVPGDRTRGATRRRPPAQLAGRTPTRAPGPLRRGRPRRRRRSGPRRHPRTRPA